MSRRFWKPLSAPSQAPCETYELAKRINPGIRAATRGVEP